MHKDLSNIQASLNLLNDQSSEQLIALTYSIFFKACPKAKSLWEKDDPISRNKMFNATLLSVIDKLTRPEVSQQYLKTDINDHQGYKVENSMYLLYFDAIVSAFEQVLGELFTDDIKASWLSQFRLLEEDIDLIHRH